MKGFEISDDSRQRMAEHPRLAQALIAKLASATVGAEPTKDLPGLAEGGVYINRREIKIGRNFVIDRNAPIGHAPTAEETATADAVIDAALMFLADDLSFVEQVAGALAEKMGPLRLGHGDPLRSLLGVQ